MVNPDSTVNTDSTVNLDWRVRAHAGVSLVALVVENPTATPRRVRVANRLDGPVRPPRREGVPEAGWDDGGFESVVAAGATRPLGYACPAPSAEPPAELIWTERAGETERAGQTECSETFVDGTSATYPSPENVVRTLGAARPPADAVPTVNPDPDAKQNPPDAVASWLAAVEERATRGDDGSSEPTPDDRAALAAVARRIQALRGTETPRETETFRRSESARSDSTTATDGRSP